MKHVKCLIKPALLFLLWMAILIQGKETGDSTPACPIGFSLIYKKDKYSPFCIRRKGPELFADIDRDCIGNLYTSKLHEELNISKPDYPIWTEYKSLYPGGVFVDWSHTRNIGDILDSENELTLDPAIDLDRMLCLVIDPVTNFTVVKCNSKHYRYCVVKPYVHKDPKNDGCEGYKDFLRFGTPVSACLTVLTGVGGGAVRATWNQAQDLCAKRGANLLSRGWRYSNYREFRYANHTNHIYPIGMIMSADYSSLRYDTINDDSEIPESEWNFGMTLNSSDTFLGALRDDFWYLVNSSYIFYGVICERSVEIRNVSLEVAIDMDNKLTLTVNDTLDKDYIYCFTDSVYYYPVKIKKERVDETDVFVLKPKYNGYYWCTHIDARNFKITESNKVLFIREKDSLINVYSIKLNYIKQYKLEDINKLQKAVKTILEEYIYIRTKYESVYGDVNMNMTEAILKGFKDSNPGLEWRENTVIEALKIKRLYLDRRTILIHVVLRPDMKPVTPGIWEGIEIVFMKPVFYCKGFDTIPQVSMGQSTKTVVCRTHTCVGDFNEGVQWVITATADCSTRAPVAIDRSLDFKKDTVTLITPTLNPELNYDGVSILRNNTTDSSEEDFTTESTLYDQRTTTTSTMYYPPRPPTSTIIPTEVSTVNTPDSNETTTEGFTVEPNTTLTPTTTEFSPTTRPPSEQLEQVINDLDTMINATSPILVDDISDVFNKVDGLLELHDDLEIPGRLLHLLDNLGSTIELNGSRTGRAVRSNIALLLADAAPEYPIRGMKLAARDTDMFTESAFEIFSGEVNSTILDSEANEVVVYLPQSVSDLSRRVSFVVFRNDRAFQTSEGSYSVNSRVLSVKVEDVTTFENGDVIDIHFTPMTADFTRNTSRTCAYWQFLHDGTGFWSSDGCTLIRATEPGTLDTCRCTHLTHFAEVLFPRSVFSEKNENVLEVLTIIGCCLSIFGLIMVGVTAAMFRSWRRDYSNKIWLQLCISILLMALSFLVVIFARFDHYTITCMLVGVVLHYSVLSSFCWMLVAAVLSYRRLVLVFTRDASHKLLRASAFSWGAPCAIIGILLSVAPHSYAGRFEEKSPSGSFCYPSGLSMWLAVYMPIAIILIVNWTLFGLIVRSVFASRGIQRHGDSNEALRCASVSCLLVFLFGLPWIFGLFAFNIVAAYLFTLSATYQGFMLFLFFVLGNKKTRDLWLNKLKIKQTRKVPVTSSTYSNRSTGYRGGTRPSSIEAKTSKPKSLNQDDSRFS